MGDNDHRRNAIAPSIGWRIMVRMVHYSRWSYLKYAILSFYCIVDGGMYVGAASADGTVPGRAAFSSAEVLGGRFSLRGTGASPVLLNCMGEAPMPRKQGMKA
jgi:hypothetical protein